MTQPRKEQVKNLKTKFTRFSGVQSLAIGGGPVQSVANTSLEAFYDNFLSVMKTDIVGGAETSAPAILYGGSGPFALVAGDTFTLQLPGVASDLPMTIIVQAGDVVTLGGSPVVTTARIADRINQAVFGFGVTAPVAANANGQLILTSVGTAGQLVGDSVIMTLTEVTGGVLNTLGFTTLSSVTATGTTAPKRGVVTVSADGQGGVVQLRKVDATVPDAVNSVVRHTLGGYNVPDYAHGQPTYARLIAFPGPVINGRNLRFSFFRSGPVRPQVITSQTSSKSNFATLTGGDSVAVSLDFGNGQTLNFNVTFSGVTTVQSAVDKFNQAYRDASYTATSDQLQSTLPHVVFRLAGPYRFTDPATIDSFFFSLNGLAPLHFNPPAGRYTNGELEAYVGALIASYGGFQGQAFQYTAPDGSIHVGMRSENTDTSVSQVRIFPGNPGGSAPGTYMGTLDMLGITPGIYKGGTVAELYGLDEINIHCPSPLPGAILTVSGSPVTMAKLGLPTSVNVSSATGVQPVVAPTSHALIPEMVEFHEERDDYDSLVQDFDNKSPYSGLKPQDGVANAGLDQLLGVDGKLDPSLLPRVLQTLGVDRLFLGNSMLGDTLRSLNTPKISASHNANPFGVSNLLFESLVDSSSLADRWNLRVYTDSEGLVLITQNCVIQDFLGSPTAFKRDTNPSDVGANDSFMIWWQGSRGILRHSFRKSTDPSPWDLDGWQTTVQSDVKGQSIEGNLLTLGQNMNASAADRNKPRLGTPVATDQFTLIYSGKATGTGKGNVRVYLTVGSAIAEGSQLVITVNAVRDNFNIWSKDVAGVDAAFYGFGNRYFRVQTRVLDATWDDDNWLEQQLWNMNNASGNEIQGFLTLGDSVIDPGTARLTVKRQNPGTNRRILFFESPPAGPFSQVPLRIYLNTGSSILSDGYTFTYNAKWDQALDKWVQDVPLFNSYALSMHNPNLYYFRKAAGSANWTEDVSGWDSYDALSMYPGQEGFIAKNGTFRVDRTTANIAAATAPLSNATYAKSMIKSWGKVRGDGPLITNVSLLDGFNCNFTGYDGGAGAYANYFATAMDNTHYAVLFSGRATNGGIPPVEPGSYFAWSGSKLHLYSAVLIGQATYGYSYYPLVGTNGAPSSALGDIRGHFMYFVVVGAQ